MRNVLVHTVTALIATLLFGCAAPLVRYEYSSFYSMTDQQLCLIGMAMPKTHPDFVSLDHHYRKRQDDGRFVHQQCVDYYAKHVAAKQADDRAILFGMVGAVAAGAAAGYASRPTPTYAPQTQPASPAVSPTPFVPRLMPTNQPAAKTTPVIPYTPSPLLLMSSTQNSNSANAMIICTYGPYGSSQRTLFIPAPGTCPNSLPQ